jgi:hypothetical protein
MLCGRALLASTLPEDTGSRAMSVAPDRMVNNAYRGAVARRGAVVGRRTGSLSLKYD